MSLELSILLGLSALAAGAINSVAGGGTLLTFPALLAVIPHAAANATSTVALVPGSLAGAWGYRREVQAAWPFIRILLLPSIAGGLLGAWLVIRYEKVFAELVPWLILTAAVLFLIQQPVARWMRQRPPAESPGRGRTIALMLAQFLIATYGGYFGAGIGILMLTSLGFMGVGNIHRMNGVKTLLAAVINAASVAVFMSSELIHWRFAALMAVAAIAGGYLGARFARTLPPVIVRGMVIVIGFGLAIYYFTK